MRYSLTAFICILFIGCNRSNEFSGLWKIRKVEILKNNELNKVIDTGEQYWCFRRKAVIEIFDKHKMQNTLHVKIGDSSIKSFDAAGHLQDEFIIHKVDDSNLALASSKKLDDDNYNVIYYLDKVKDTSAREIKNGF
jgi:hypothetical protein